MISITSICASAVVLLSIHTTATNPSLVGVPNTAAASADTGNGIDNDDGRIKDNAGSDWKLRGNFISPSWQSVVPDTGLVFPLFGKSSHWVLRSSDGTYQNLSANIPGDVLSDLMRNGLIDDPYYERNFLTQRRVWMGPLRETPKANESFLEQRTRTWIYTTEFILPETFHDKLSYELVIEGIKMGASLSVNGFRLGNVTDQFLRYTFHIDPITLSKGTATHNHTTYDKSSPLQHRLDISFDPSIGTDHGRFTACSGGWDWAPYSRAGETRSDGEVSRVFSFGIVKPIYIVAIKSSFITHVPKTYYQGEYPRKPMMNGPEGDFNVSINIHLESPITISDAPTTTVLPLKDEKRNNILNNNASSSSFILLQAQFHSDWPNHEIKVPITPQQQQSRNFIVTVNIIASKDFIQLWWPNRMGPQTLYSLYVAFQTDRKQTQWMETKIGFRTAALVTVNDTNTALVQNLDKNGKKSEGNGDHGMFFRINGALVNARGANFIPMDQLEGRLTDEAHQIAVQSAAMAGMNMLRVWGGGMILPTSFYQACNRHGILIYHDMMFVEEKNHGPTESQVQQKEIRFIVRSLLSHPSVVVWSGCNECTVRMDSHTKLYASFVMRLVADEDDTRPIWPSCPSRGGWKTGVDTIHGHANGNDLLPKLPERHVLEVHGPYRHGYSGTHPGVNGHEERDDDNTPPMFKKDAIGPDLPNFFISEFGSSVFSSFESMSATLDSESWSVHGGSEPNTCIQLFGNENICVGENTIAERNYPCDSLILQYFGNNNELDITLLLDSVGEHAFQAQLYLCMIAQLLWMKGQIEFMRSKNSFGTLIWQFNENWPTGGWGLVEFGSNRHIPGQIIGGRWKPLMHLLEASLFRDVFAACGKFNYCYVRNDGLLAMEGTVWIEAWHLSSTNQPEQVVSQNFSLPGGIGATERFKLPLTIAEETADLLSIRVEDLHRNILMHDTTFLWNVPAKSLMKRLAKQIKITVSVSNTTTATADGYNFAEVSLESNLLALYVVLTTQAEGRFNENAFSLWPERKKVVMFIPMMQTKSIDFDCLRSTLRVEHLGSYFSHDWDSR